MALVSRDPFARQEIHRRRVYTDGNEGCFWCGRHNVTPSGREYLYRYSIERDSIRQRSSEVPGQFCSEGCRKDYQE